MKIFNSYNLQRINFQAEEKQNELPVIKDDNYLIDDGFVNNDFVQTTQAKKSNLATKDILLALGFLTSAATAGVALYKNKSLNNDLKKALANLSNAEKSQKELTTKLDEITKKAEKSANEAAENLKKANQRKTETITVYKDRKVQLTPEEIAKEANRLIQEKKLQFRQPEKINLKTLFKVFIYKLLTSSTKNKQELGKEAAKTIKQTPKNKEKILNNHNNIDKNNKTNKKEKSFFNKLRFNLEIFLFDLRTRKNLKIDKKAFLNTEKNKIINLGNLQLNTNKNKAKESKPIYTNKNKSFIKKLKTNFIAILLNLKTKKSIPVDKKAFLNTNNDKAIKLDKPIESSLKWTNIEQNIDKKSNKNLKKRSKKDQIFTEKKEALKKSKRKNKSNKTSKKWAKKFHLYRTKSAQKSIKTKNSENNHPKISIKQKIKKQIKEFINLFINNDDF